NYLGMAWELINPAIQIMIYWFVFGTIRKRAPIEMGGVEVPFFAWLLAGFFLWFFCCQSIIMGSMVIFSRFSMLSILSLRILVIFIFIFHFIGYHITIYYLQFIYFIFAAMCMLFAISLITSTLSTIVRDFHMFLNSTLRMLLYMSGVLWPITLLDDFPLIMKLMMFNPLFYLIEGYRAAFFGTEWYFITHWQYSLYFWGLVILLLLVGSALHVKFRRHFIDYL